MIPEGEKPDEVKFSVHEATEPKTKSKDEAGPSEAVANLPRQQKEPSPRNDLFGDRIEVDKN